MNTSETIVGHGIFAVVKDSPILARHVMETLSTGDNEELEESLAFVKPAMGEIEKYDPETGSFEGHLLTSERVLQVAGFIHPSEGSQLEAGSKLTSVLVTYREEIDGQVSVLTEPPVCAFYLGAPVTSGEDARQHKVIPGSPISTAGESFPPVPYKVYEAGFSGVPEDGDGEPPAGIAFALVDSLAAKIYEKVNHPSTNYALSGLHYASWCNEYDAAIVDADTDFYAAYANVMNSALRGFNSASLRCFKRHERGWEDTAKEERQVVSGSKLAWEMNDLANRIDHAVLSLDKLEAAIGDIRESLQAYHDAVKATSEYSYEAARDIYWYQLRHLIARGAFKNEPDFPYPELNDRPWDYRGDNAGN